MPEDAGQHADATTALARWNDLDAEAAAEDVLSCCGSRAWAQGLAARRPFADALQLFEEADWVWAGLAEDDWREAFESHPRIGQSQASAATPRSLAWSSEEQSAVLSRASEPGSDHDATELALAEGNRQYEERFGRIFIVCAADKSAAQILAILEGRMQNTAADEILEAAEQQRQITRIRLRRWLGAAV